MIETFEGRLGGGKSYTAVQRIVNVLCSGGYVATNINLKVEEWEHPQYGKQRGLREICKLRGWSLRDDQIIYLPDYEYIDFQSRQDGKSFRLSKLQAFWTLIPRVSDGVILVVIDEAHFHFPQSGFRSIPNDVVEFLTLSRHARVDIIFISQHIKNMWCQMSRLAQYRWEFRDLKKYGMYFQGRFPIPSMTLPWPFPHILQSQYDYDGKTLLSKKYDWHDKTIHECYDSPALISAFASAGEVSTIKNTIKGKLTMGQKIIITLTGASLASVVWAIVYFKNPRVQTVTVERVVTNFVGSAASGVCSSGSSSKPEYLQSVVIGCGADRLTTTKRTYRKGDVIEGGAVVVGVSFDGVDVVTSSGRSSLKFNPAPREVVESKPASISPPSFSIFGKRSDTSAL